MFSLFNKEEKEYNYFKTFETISSQIMRVSNLLLEYLDQDSIILLEDALHESEASVHVANEQRNELLNYLYDDFLPPIERQDIIGVIYTLDTVLKKTADIMIHLDMYQIKVIQPEMGKLIEIIAKVTHEIPPMMKNLEDFKHPEKIRESIIEIQEANKLASETYHLGVKKLNIGEMNSFETMKYTRMYECLYEVLQAVEGLIHRIVAVIIQNT